MGFSFINKFATFTNLKTHQNWSKRSKAWYIFLGQTFILLLKICIASSSILKNHQIWLKRDKKLFGMTKFYSPLEICSLQFQKIIKTIKKSHKFLVLRESKKFSQYFLRPFWFRMAHCAFSSKNYCRKREGPFYYYCILLTVSKH